MAYAAVTSLMETLYQHFLQSQPRLPIEDLEAQIRIGNENVGLLQQILEAQIREKEASSKRLRIKAYFPRLFGKQQLVWDTIFLTSQLKEMAEFKQKIVSLREIPYDDARVRVMKDLEAQIRDASFKLEERIEMELSTIYLAKDRLHITACLLRLHQIFIEAEKRTDHHRNELIRIQSDEYQQLAKVSLLGRIRRRGLLQLVKGSSLHHLVHKKIIASNFSKKASKFDGGMVGCEKLFEKVMDQLLTQQTTKGRQIVSVVGMEESARPL